MHVWGNKDKQGRDICYRVGDAAYYIGNFIARWGRIQVAQTKEKFGTARVYCYWGWDSFHGIIWPKHVWIHSWWPYGFDLWISRWVMPFLNWISNPYRKWIYRLAYKKAIKKNPDLYREIICSADYDKLLEGLWGYRHKDYWRDIHEETNK